MDSEEHVKLMRKISGPPGEREEVGYKYHATSEAYKANVAGKLSGLMIGAMIGAVAGGIAAAALAFAVPALSAVAAIGVVAGFAAGGMIYGAHELGQIGTAAGANAAVQEMAEKRSRIAMDGKFAEVNQKLDKLDAIIENKPLVAQAEDTQAIKAAADLDNSPRTSHFQKELADALPEKNRYVFWKVAVIGAVVGVAAGALLAGGGLMEPLVHSLGSAFGGSLESLVTSTAGKYIASMTAMGAIGASFGINRDIFRKIFDVAEKMTHGMIGHNGPEKAPVIAQAVEKSPEVVKSEPRTINTVVYDNGIQYPESSTYHRDKVMISAQQAMLSMDPTNSIRH